MFVLLLGWSLAALVTTVHAASPGDFDYRIPVVITNNGIEGVAGLFPVVIKAKNLVDEGYLRSDGGDLLFTDQGDVAIEGFAQDLGLTSATWWVEADVPTFDDSTAYIYLGDSESSFDGRFPLRSGFGSRDKTKASLIISSRTSLNMTSKVDLSIEVETASCGFIADKMEYSGDKGYGMRWLGEIDTANPTITGSNTSTRYQYYQIDVVKDVHVCGVGVAGNVRRVSIYDVDASSVIHYSHNPITTHTGNSGIALLEEPVPLEADSSYGVLLEYFATSPLGYGAWSATSSEGHTYKANAHYYRVGGRNYYRHGDIDPGIMFTDPSEPTGTLSAYIGTTGLSDTLTQTWDGSRATWRMTFDRATNETDFYLYKDGEEVASKDSSLYNIGLNNKSLRIGAGMDGWVDNLVVKKGTTTSLDLRFEPDHFSQTHAGTSSNGWRWQGTVANAAGSGSVRYQIDQDMTNVSVSAEPLIVVSVGGFSVGPADVAGDTDVSTFFQKKERTKSPVSDGLFDAAKGSGLPSSAWWLAVLTGTAVMLTAVVYRWMPSLWVASAIGMGVYLAGVGAGAIEPWIAAIFGVWAFGVTAVSRLGMNG